MTPPVLAQNPASLSIDQAALAQRKESVHTYLLNIYIAQKRKPEAMAEYKTLLAMKPDDPALNNDLGKFEASSGQFASAAVHTKKACDLDPANSNNWGNLAAIYLKMKDYPKALDAYDHAIAASKSAGQEASRFIELRNQTFNYVQHLKKQKQLTKPKNDNLKKHWVGDFNATDDW